MLRFFTLLAIGTTLLGAAAAAPAQTSSTAALQLLQRAPLRVQGRHFKARELVRVRAYAGQETRLRLTRSTRQGTFRVDFGTFPENPCLVVTVRARGTRGDRATLVIEPPPSTEVPCRQ
jgi:hypothetical protein